MEYVEFIIKKIKKYIKVKKIVDVKDNIFFIDFKQNGELDEVNFLFTKNNCFYINYKNSLLYINISQLNKFMKIMANTPKSHTKEYAICEVFGLYIVCNHYHEFEDIIRDLSKNISLYDRKQIINIKNGRYIARFFIQNKYIDINFIIDKDFNSLFRPTTDFYKKHILHFMIYKIEKIRKFNLNINK